MKTSTVRSFVLGRMCGALVLALFLVAGCGSGGGGEGSGGTGSIPQGGPGDGSIPAPTATLDAGPAATPVAEQAPTSTPLAVRTLVIGPTEPTPTQPDEATPTPIPTAPNTPSGAVAREDVAFPGCAAVMAEEHYCLTVSGAGIALLGLDSGALCPVAPTTAAVDGYFSASIGWLGEEMYICAYESGLLRVSLRDGSVEAANLPCAAVTDYRGGLLVSSWPFSESFENPLQWYADFSAATQGVVGAQYSLGAWSSRMTTTGDAFYGAWHSTTSIDVGDLSTDQPVGVLTLDSYDGWILGLAVTNDGVLVISRGEEVGLFDVRTGQQLRTLHPTGSVAGLSCVSPAHRTPPPVPSVPPVTPSPTPTPCGAASDEDGMWYDGCGSSYCAELSASLPDRQRADFPPSIPIAMNCGGGGYGSSNYVNPIASPDAAAELHVVGVYEGKGNAGFRSDAQGVVDVLVHERPKPVVLFLSAYESMLWRIEIEPGAQVARVITQGYGDQAVSGVPAEVPVEHRGPGETCAYAYGWEVEHNTGGGGYHLMIATARDLTGLTETSFQGCYNGDRFEIPYWSGEPPIQHPTPVPGDERVPNQQMTFPGCESVTAERQFCLTSTYGALALLGLDSGQVCPVTNTGAAVGNPLASSLVWRGELAYTCTGSGLVRISLRDGSWESAQVPCGGVAEYDGGLALLGSILDLQHWGTPLIVYPSYAAVLAGQPSHEFPFGNGSFSSTIHGDTFYGAWHSTNTINAVGLSTGVTRDITLEGYDGWILGMAVTDDGELVISGDTWGDTVRLFDAQTGLHLRDIHPSTPVFGLSCVTREPVAE